MSVAVALDRLREEIDRYGAGAYLLSVTEEATPHAVSVSVGWSDDELAVEAGRRTASNLEAHPTVTLLWPATEPTGFALIVDGTGRVDGDRALIRPTAAVLHRSRAVAEEVGGDSCVKLVD